MTSTNMVSVLMPVFKPEFMREALLSVLNQTHTHMEILIGDNSGNPEILDIIAEFNDARVTYIPSHLVTGASVHINHMLLWWRAKGRYVRYVYDDDVAYPRSSEVLLKLITQQPGTVMSWHQRDVIDANSHVLSRQNFLGDRATVMMDRSMVLSNLSYFLNFIGEPSFVMFDKAMYKEFDFNRYDGYELRFLWDVGAYLGAVKAGFAAGSAEVLGGFRRHDNQISAAVSKNFIFGLIEWELVFRNELNKGLLTEELAYAVLKRITLLYESYEATVPSLRAFREQLQVDVDTHRIAEGAALFKSAYLELVNSHGK